jgi:AcrR family transcriptional regulator
MTVLYSAQGSRLNRRGLETRGHIIDTAIRCLAEGDREAVSANLIAKSAGVTWGTIQHQFGDSDGVWAAVLEHASIDIAERLPSGPKREPSLARRVAAIVDTLWRGFDEPTARAVQNLRRSLPQDYAGLASEFPATAEALQELDDQWAMIFDEILEGLVSSTVKRRRVRHLIPSAVRGIHTQAQLSNIGDVDEARGALVDVLVAYLRDET